MLVLSLHSPMVIVATQCGIEDATAPILAISGERLEHVVLRLDGNPLLPLDKRMAMPSVLNSWLGRACGSRSLSVVTFGFSECGLSCKELEGVACWREWCRVHTSVSVSLVL